MAQPEQVPQEAVQVHVCLGATAAAADKQRSTRSTAELLSDGSGLEGARGPSEPACPTSPVRGSTCSGSPAWLLWLLFVLGFICPPCWWTGSIMGLQSKRKASHSAGMSSSATAAWHGCIAMSVISTVAIVLGFAIHYGRKQPVPKEYFFTLNQASTDMNSTSSSSNALLQPASTLNTTFAEALHAALRLPAAYPVSSIHVWLEDATQPAQQRRLQEAAPLQEQQQQQAIVLAVWGFQLWPSRSLPRAEVLASDVVTGEDAGMSVVLQLIAAGAIDPRAMAQLQGSISTSREDAFAAQVDNAEGSRPMHADDMASEVLQYPPKPLPPGACTCRIGWDKERLGMVCPSPWASPAGTTKVPPALAVVSGRLVERASGAPAELHGVDFFGWNTDTPNFDGLWAYNDDEIPGYDSVGDAGALQMLNISWWGKRRVANDFAAVVHRMGLLGFNAVRVQFTFENLNRELPAGAEPEFYPCLHDSDAYIGLDKTVDPQLTKWLAANNQQPDALLPLLPPYTGMQHPPPNNSGNPRCNSMPWSAPFGTNYTVPNNSSSTGSSNSLQLTMCNWYLPQGPGVLAVHRFLWQVQYLVSQGFYVLLDFASHRRTEPNMQQPQLLAANWAALWRMLTELPSYDQHLAGRVFPDLVNEPSRWNCQWDASCRPSNATSRSCAPVTHLFGMATGAIWQQDAAVPIFLNGLGQNRDYTKDQCGGNYPSMSWGDGFITDPEAVQQHGLGDPSSLLATVAKMQGRHAGLVLAPHLYPPSITWNPAELAAAAAERWDLSWGLKWEGQDVTPEGTPLPAMPVVLGEFGSKDYGDNSNTNSDTTVYSDLDRQWLQDTAAYMRGLAGSVRSPVSWFFWAWNANSGDTKGIVGPGTTWREVQWTKVRMLTREYGLRPWYCAYFPAVCNSIDW